MYIRQPKSQTKAQNHLYKLMFPFVPGQSGNKPVCAADKSSNCSQRRQHGLNRANNTQKPFQNSPFNAQWSLNMPSAVAYSSHSLFM
jgi:hypothetical protein